MPDVTMVTQRERPDLVTEVRKLSAASWPTYILADPVGVRYVPELETRLAEFQLILLDAGDDTILGTAHSIPFGWNGEPLSLPSGWDEVLKAGMQTVKPTALSALSIVVHHEHRGQKLSLLLIRALRKLALTHNLRHFVAPVRPSAKVAYPLTPMNNYLTWLRPDGTPFDPWVRVHVREGARILQICWESMVITSTIVEWESWTGMRFPENGKYIIPGGLVPLSVNVESNVAEYVEPNVWMEHSLT